MDTKEIPAPLPAPVSLTLEQMRLTVEETKRVGGGLVTNLKIYGGYPPFPSVK